MQLEDAWPANYTSGNTTAWESENDWPMAELIADMYQALDRLECPSAGEKSSSRGFIPVRRYCFVWSFAHVLVLDHPIPHCTVNRFPRLLIPWLIF
jgi:hypothetical protein